MRTKIVVGLFSLFASFSPGSWAQTFIAIGDQPYGDIGPFESLIETINRRSQSAFTIHVGDIKSGSTLCSDAYFLKIHELFERFQKPLIFTPGDNEWTDCHRPNNGAFEPQERLKKLREIFFKDSLSLGQEKIKLLSQAHVDPRHQAYVENQTWEKEGLIFVTLHQVGSNNNLDLNIAGARQEYEARNRANLAWLERAYQEVATKKARGLIIAMQADTFDFYIPQNSGFKDFLQSFGSLANKQNIPTLVIQGDSHQYILDRPFSHLGKKLNHVQRLVVPGANLSEAVQVQFKDGQFYFERFGLSAAQ
ncbi:MAG: hypothetical protein EBS31_01590 [Burkholderiaceae bacterium]|nr:hypothetical protein [Burkholderiaceae bacterium]